MKTLYILLLAILLAGCSISDRTAQNWEREPVLNPPDCYWSGVTKTGCPGVMSFETTVVSPYPAIDCDCEDMLFTLEDVTGTGNMTFDVYVDGSYTGMFEVIGEYGIYVYQCQPTVTLVILFNFPGEPDNYCTGDLYTFWLEVN